jgi:DNA repair protein RadC
VAPRPSPEDVQLNRTLAEAGRIMDVNVLDDLVIGHDEYVSLKDRRLGF